MFPVFAGGPKVSMLLLWQHTFWMSKLPVDNVTVTVLFRVKFKAKFPLFDQLSIIIKINNNCFILQSEIADSQVTFCDIRSN